MADSDSAFLWETEALRNSPARAMPAATENAGQARRGEDWKTLREASRLTSIPVPTLRKWARHENVESYLAETPVGQLRMVSMQAVYRRAEELGRAIRRLEAAPNPPSPPDRSPAVHREEKTPSVAPTAKVPESTVADTPAGTMLVPIDAWDKMLMQLGNLHEAGQQLAEARERAAKAETEARFLRERLSELKSEISATRDRHPDGPDDRGVGEPPGLEENREPDETDVEIDVRQIAEEGATRAPGDRDAGLSLPAYSMAVAKHLYSTWRGRPRR